MPFQKSEMDGMYRIEKGCMKPALEQFKIHAFAGRASADVYDQTQTDSSIKDGDLLDLGGGNIGILLQAWPTVVCGEIDQFHTLADGESFDSYQEGKYSAAARKAREIAALAVRTTDTKKQSPLEIVESVCRDFDGDGLASVGATAALRAMSEHWKNHLNEGRKPRIMSEDIDELKEQLEVMRAEIMRRLEAVTCDTAAPAVTSATGV